MRDQLRRCNLQWKELLSAAEVRSWIEQQQVPKRLTTDLAYPGVYRFIFPEARDAGAAHTPCYVGEAGNSGKRLRAHFRLESQDNVPMTGPRTLKLRAGWLVRGSLQNSRGNFSLEILAIEGPVSFCGLAFGPDSIPPPFENSFLRKMLENWAILASEHVEHLWPLNVRGTPHILADILKNARGARSRKANTVAK
jgi:hypothetical protein